MDLRGILNDNGPAASRQAKPTQPAPQQPPSTPVQAPPGQQFRDYSQTAQVSPSRPMSQDFTSQLSSGLFGSPPSYHTPAPYATRPQPPTLQQVPPNDLRSPRIAAGPGLVHSPYRQTPTSSISGPGTGYPFPPTNQTPTSPVQLHQYPPQTVYHRDNYPQPTGPAGMTGSAVAPPYMQGQPIPQTPPVATQGGAHPYLHQRSQSTHSTPTPTSAQSQGHYGVPFVQGSPVATTHPLPGDHHQHQRQDSQPPTPLGPPMPGARQSSTNYAQPPSPYQQRLSSTGSYIHQHSAQASPLQNSPPAPPPPGLPRHPSAHILYESQAPADPHRGSQLQSEREKSISVSPKTRIPSLPSSAGRPVSSRGDAESLHMQPHQSAAMGGDPNQRAREQGSTPAKRKLDDRDLKLDELEKRDVRPAPFEKVNGNHVPASATDPSAASASASPVVPKRKRRTRYSSAPVWAQPFQSSRKLNAANYILHKPVHDHMAELNGKPEVKSELSRHASPEGKRAAPAPPQHQAPPPAAPEIPNMGRPLGPWEQAITGTPPIQEIVKEVADFLYLNIAGNDRRGEIMAHGIEFEIEAKLGKLIDRNTNDRLSLPVLTECIVNHRETAFRSSMTAAQHRQYNDFLNEAVRVTHPQNRANVPKPRLQVEYKHRREIDRFFELPAHMRQQLPPYVESLINSRHGLKVRVTYDEKTKEVLAKIIKARVADLDIYMPKSLLDLRISINLEMAWDMPVEELERICGGKKKDSPDRNKDRVSYRHGPYQIDLTQVKSMLAAGHQPTAKDVDKEHELEIELSVAALLDQAKRLQEGQDNQFTELVEGFIDNAKILSRKASEFKS